MKKLLTGLLLLCTIALFAQDNDDHRDKDRKNQQNNSKYYNVNNNGQWHATYRDLDDKDHDAYYDDDGRRLDMHNGDRNRGQAYNQNEIPYKLRRRLDRRYHSDYRAI